MATGIRKRGDSYEAWVYDKRTKQKHRRTFRTEAAAKSWRADATGQVERRELRPQTRLTIEQAWETWLEGARAGSIRKRKTGERYKPSTLRSYESDMTHILPDIGAVRTSELTRFDVQALADRWLAEDVSASAIRNRIMPLRAIYRQQIKSGAVTVNPLALLELPGVDGTREWTGTKETAALIVAAVPEGDRALWATALYAGLRAGELRALRWEHIGAHISVVDNWDPREGRVDPKSKAGTRKVPIPQTLRTLLLEHRLRSGRSSGLVFGRDGSRPFDPASMSARADTSFEEHGLERVTLQQCRHGYRSFLDDIEDVSEVRADRYQGHSSTHVRRRYIHELDGQIEKDAERIERYIAGASAGASLFSEELKTASLSQI